MSSGTMRLCTRLGAWIVVCLIAATDTWSEAGASNIRWSIGCNVDYYFSPLRLTNGDLKKAGYPEITSSTPQLGLELTRFKYDLAGNAKRSLSFLYIYWQGEGRSGDYGVKVRFHEFAAKVRVYLFRHFAVSPFLGCGVGFQTGAIKTYTPLHSVVIEGEYRNSGGVISLLTGIEWQNKPKGGIFRLESGYRHIPSTSEWPRGARINTSCWFVGATFGIKM